MLSSILRIIEGTKSGDIDKVLRYVMRILPEYELEGADECIREMFDPKVASVVMDNSEEVEQLRDELDALNMRYVSQVSLWKGLYYGLKKEKEK